MPEMNTNEAPIVIHNQIKQNIKTNKYNQNNKCNPNKLTQYQTNKSKTTAIKPHKAQYVINNPNTSNNPQNHLLA